MAGDGVRTDSGADYTLKLGLDTSAVEKAQKRVERILSRTSKVERRINSQRVSAASKVLKIEKQITQERRRGISTPTTTRRSRDIAPRENFVRPTSRATTERSPRMDSQVSGVRRQVNRSPAPRSRVVPELESLKTLDKIDELTNKIKAKGAILDTGEIASATAKLDNLSKKIKATSNPREFAKLKRQYSEINKNINQAIRNSERLNRSLTLQQFASKGLRQSLANLARSYASVYFAIEAGKFFINITKRIETAEVALINAAGSAAKAAEDFKFVKRLASELGLEVLSTATAFGKFGAAAKLGGLSAEDTQIAFSNIAKAVAGAALTADRASLVFQAFQQVMSKGVLSMEEVRQQIGESLPQAIGALSTVTGKADQELFKFIESGQALSRDVLPAWTAELARLSEESGALEKSTNSLNARWNRFLNTLTETIGLLGEVGGEGILSSVLEVTSDIVKVFNDFLRLLKQVASIFGIIGDSADLVEDSTGKVIKKLSFFGRLIKKISGMWDVIVGSIRTALSLLTVFLREWEKAGVTGLFDAAKSTSAILEASKLAAQNNLSRVQKAEQAQRDKKFQDNRSVTISMENNITSTDPALAAQEVEKVANKVVDKWWSKQTSSAF